MSKIKKRAPIRFKGWDWSELLQLEHIARVWPKVPEDLVVPDLLNREDAEAAYQIRTYLQSLVWVETVEAKRERALVCKKLRKFCLALARAQCTTEAPVWAGMAALTHDETLIRWVDDCLEKMWT